MNRTSSPNYRLFIDYLEVTLKHFSNQFVEGPAMLDLKGKFMGTGDTRVTGTFRPKTKSADFTVKAAIENTQMAAMSDSSVPLAISISSKVSLLSMRI